MKPTAAHTAYRPAIKAKKGTLTSRPAISELPTFASAQVGDDFIEFMLSDGRQIRIPLAWSERLTNATPAQRQQFIVSAWNVFWDDVDEIIGVENVLYGDKLYLRV